MKCSYNNSDVYLQDQTSPFINWMLSQKLNTVTLASNSNRGDLSITLSNGHGVVTGNYLEIYEGNLLQQVEVVNVATNVITIAKPLLYSFTTSCIMNRVNVNVNVNGSVTPVNFTFKSENTLSYDFYGVSAIIATSTEPDDSKFGGINALTNGIYIGKINPGKLYDSFPYNFKKNSCFKLNSFAVEYTNKAGGSNYGIDLKKNWKDTHGVIPRVLPGEYIIAKIRDDLSTLIDFKIMMLGHIVV